MTSRSNPAVRYLALDLSGGNVVLNPPCRGVTIGGAGVITGIAVTATTASATGSLPVGTYALEMKQINQTGTTATNITVWW